MKLAIAGAGWAGCSAAVEATRLGHQVTLFETTRHAGGRARRVELAQGGKTLALDNGQHILIGAYSETLRLMHFLGVDLEASLLRTPLSMQFPDGSGLRLPALPAPFDAVAGIIAARGWSLLDKISLIRAAIGWQMRKFRCEAHLSVAELCKPLTAAVMGTLIEPLCVAALNTPAERASGQVFLRVLQDALFSATGASNLLLPRTDLGALLPDAALEWLQQNGAQVRLGNRVQSIRYAALSGWELSGDAFSGIKAADTLGTFDQVILACPPTEAARLVKTSTLPCENWLGLAQALQHEAIATVYARSAGTRLQQPMLALAANDAWPAQFVFDRGQLGGPAGLLAFVVSASTGDSATLAQQVIAQAQAQLGLDNLQVLQTIVEKRATFACTPGLQRPGRQIAEGLFACGDYIDGPYPATLEGAVRSGLEAARQLKASWAERLEMTE